MRRYFRTDKVKALFTSEYEVAEELVERKEFGTRTGTAFSETDDGRLLFSADYTDIIRFKTL